MGHRVNIDVYNKSIDDLKRKYEDQKSKKFVEHLIKSFLPINPLNRIYEFGNDTDKSCCLSGFRLASIKEMIEAAKKSGVDEQYINNMDILCSEEGDEAYSLAIDNYNNSCKDKKKRIYKNIRDKDYAFTSDSSSRVLSTEGILALESFAEEEIKSGNKSIKFLLNRNKKVSNNTRPDKKIPTPKPQRKVESKKSSVNQFSAFDELVELKKKLEGKN